MSWSRENNFRYVEITRKLSRDHEKTRQKNYNNAWPLRTSVQLTIKECYLKKTPSHFMLSAMAPHGREMSQDLRKIIIYLHKKGEGYKKISKALLISQNTVAKVVQTFKKYGTATISQRRPGRPRKLTPRQERLLMRRVEENRHASSLQLSKEVESQTGVTISRDTIRRTLQRNGMHGCRPRKKPLLKPRHKKARLEFARPMLTHLHLHLVI